MGLMGSAFGRALSGAGEAAANLAGKYIDEEIQQNRMQAMADIQRQSATHQRNDQFAFENDPNNVAARNATAKTSALAAGQTAQEVELARLNNAPLAEASRNRAAGDAQAAAKIKNDLTMAEAGDDKLLAARAKIELADPKVAQQLEVMKAQIRSSNASAGAAAANARQSNAQTAGIELANKDKERLGVIYDGASAALNDKTLTPEQRAKAVSEAMQQAELIKMKSSAGGGTRNPELDTVTIEEIDPKTGAKTTRKEVRRPGAAGPTAEDPYAVKPGEKPAAKPAPAKPIMEAAKERVRQSAPASGLEGLSEIAIRAIANDKANPLSAAAAAELQRLEASRRAGDEARLQDPATDPALYGGR